jgi:hypothetical protein
VTEFNSVTAFLLYDPGLWGDTPHPCVPFGGLRTAL